MSSKWFQALEGCLRLTTDFWTGGKDSKGCFRLWRTELGIWANMNWLALLYLFFTCLNAQWGTLPTVSDAKVSLKWRSRASNNFEDIYYYRCRRVIVMVPEALWDKFAAIFHPEILFLWKSTPVQTDLLLTFFLDDPVCMQGFCPNWVLIVRSRSLS